VTVDDRVAQLLADAPIEERLRGREVEAAANFLGLSQASTYRLIAQGRLGHVKLEGSRRRGHGHAGAVRVRLIDLVTFQVENERVRGAARGLTWPEKKNNRRE
jgi:excisionase family DNA binding protein